MVARAGRRPRRPRAPRSSPAARPAACAGRGRPTRRARAATPPGAARAPRDSASRVAGPGQLARESACELGRAARPRRRTAPCVAERRRVLGAAPRDQRAIAAPTASATTSATTPATARPQSDHPKSWSERNIARAVADDPGDHRDDRDQRHDGTSSQRSDRAAAATPTPSPTTPTAPAQRGRDQHDLHLVRASRRGLPPVADAPHGLQPDGPGRVGLDLLPQPAHVHGDRRLVAERPAPHLLSSSSRVNAMPGCASRKRSRSNSRPVSASGSPSRYAAWPASSTTRSPSTRPPRRAAASPRPAQHRVDPQRQLARAERLGDVVVGAELQADHPVGLLARARSA